METVARGGNCLFRRFQPFGAFTIIQNNVELLINPRDDYRMYLEKHELYGGDVKITATRKTYKISVGVYFVSERQITQSLTFITGKVVTEIKVQVYLLFSDELDNDPYAA
jgi:hypothetical protein